MFSSFLAYDYMCLNCNKKQTKMADNQPDDVDNCTSCLKKAYDLANPIKHVYDGAPTGFVKGGVSNKAGFSKNKVFSGKNS